MAETTENTQKETTVQPAPAQAQPVQAQPVQAQPDHVQEITVAPSVAFQLKLHEFDKNIAIKESKYQI